LKIFVARDSEHSTGTKCNEVLHGGELSQYEINFRRFGDSVIRRKPLVVALKISSILTKLTTREDFIALCSKVTL